MTQDKKRTQAFGAAAGQKRKTAVILTEPQTNPKVLEDIRKFLEDHDYELHIMDSTNENHFKTVGLIQQAEREKSICYIAGSATGNDPELVGAVKTLARDIVQAGFNTVYPGSGTGMMGEIAKAVKDAGGKLTSVFSLQVAEAHFEEITTDADSIVVAPNEKVRQLMYHLLSGAQIALPGGTGTYAESTVHFYQNTQIGLIYRHPDNFGPENFPSPIIYFSPQTDAVKQEYKKLLCEKFYPDNKAMQKAVMENDIEAGYWDFAKLAYENLIDMGFSSTDFRAFIKNYDRPEGVIKQLQSWNDPKVRQMLVDLINAHNRKTRDGFSHIIGHDFKVD
ncbi:MAG: LOG family protein [Rhodospirillales bacterium]|nr:LOG family protein [Rhodospirillales bacterium]